MQATPEMIEAIKRAVKHTEESWDAQRDFEMEVGRDFDGLGEWIDDLAITGWESVNRELVQWYLDEFYETAIPFGGTERCQHLSEKEESDNGKK